MEKRILLSDTESRGFSIERVCFRNIRIRGHVDELFPSVLICRESEEFEPSENIPHISDVTFENVTLNNHPITKEDLTMRGNIQNLKL